MANVDVADGESIVLEKPERGAKDGYLNTWYNERRGLDSVILQSNGISDHRIRLYVRAMISGIVDDDIRAKALQYFDDKIKEIREMKDDETKRLLSVEEQNQLIADFCCGEMAGHVSSFYDQFVGVSHRLRLGKV
jgi:hypothetical protein